MKKLLFLGVVSAISSLVNAQKISDKSVPATVKSSFQRAYPSAKGSKWEMEKGNYEVVFHSANILHAVVIDAKGNVLETEIAISIDAVPTDARAYVSKVYPGSKVREAAKITDARGLITYELEVDGKDLIFDREGKFLKVGN